MSTTTTTLKFLNEMEKELSWFNSNESTIKEKYDGKFIAIKEGEIIASNKNIKNLIELIEKKGFSTEEVIIQFVSKIQIIF